MILQNFRIFEGQHCETTTAGNLLKQLGIELSEAMLFGLGEGLGFIIWNMKSMDFPFIGGRIKSDSVTENLCRNLNLDLAVSETTSTKKAWQNVTNSLRDGKAVGLKLDCYHLEYFTKKLHFAGHYACLYGIDDEYAYLVDTYQQGGFVKTSLRSLELARNERGPMSSRNRSFTISNNGASFNLTNSVKKAIHKNAVEFLNPPIKNISYKGMFKASSEIRKWFKSSKDIKGEFQTSAMLMEKAGTGGALFRNLYRDFLGECAEILAINEVEMAYLKFKDIALLWTDISELFHEIGETSDTKLVDQASSLFLQLSEKEKQTMESLRDATFTIGE